MPAAGLRFGTKAQTLARLRGRLRHGVVLPLAPLTVGEWREEREAVLDRLCAPLWTRRALIVRSSSFDEDGERRSNAGRYLSLPDVRGRTALAHAIDAVIASYDRPTDADQVLVQPQLEEVAASGVASSREASGGGPYRVVSWSEEGGTDAVTAGRDGTRTWYALAYERVAPPTPLLAGVLELIEELEQLTAVPFELEFGVVADGPLVLFQVRPLVVSGPGVDAALHRDATAGCRAALRRRVESPGPALGEGACFGVMPDWNPAEMIGVRPRPLAVSLYRALITDELWAVSRAAYGYRDLRGLPLLVEFGGLPYIDARASFSSFVPASLADGAAERLVRHCVERLRAQPQLHDKIESEIALTAYDFKLPARAGALVEAEVLTAAEGDALVASLRTLTERMIASDGPFATDLATAAELSRLDPLRHAELPPLRRIAAGLEDCRRLGTLPFAGLARAAFTAVGIVDSLRAEGLLSDAEGAALIGGANEVTESLRRDFAALDRDSFLRRYGHLRPGTYDIRSPRYDESGERYFDWSQPLAATAEEAPRFRPSRAQTAALARLLDAHGLRCGPLQLLAFVREAVAGRERAKLDFTRLVSQLLVDVRLLGERHGLSADQLSFVPVTTLTALVDAPEREVGAELAEAVAAGAARHRVTATLCAPVLLTDEQDFASFATLDDEPNFVTHRRVVAAPADVEGGDPLEGRIALIASADPGWDWIFTHRIAGLVTAYGGANSHMALRALELELPAAIGVGEERFRRWLVAPALELDAANRLMRPLDAEPSMQAIPASARESAAHDAMAATAAALRPAGSGGL